MKKLLFLTGLIAIVTAFTPAISQTVMPASTYGKALDTVSNTGSETWTLKVKPSGNTPSYVSVISITKITGTLGGTAAFQGSIDGTNYVTIGSSSTVTDTASQTFAATASNGPPYLYYRWLWTGTGSTSGSASAKIFVK